MGLNHILSNTHIHAHTHIYKNQRAKIRETAMTIEDKPKNTQKITITDRLLISNYDRPKILPQNPWA